MKTIQVSFHVGQASECSSAKPNYISVYLSFTDLNDIVWFTSHTFFKSNLITFKGVGVFRVDAASSIIKR